jgi:hypothetical protein
VPRALAAVLDRLDTGPDIAGAARQTRRRRPRKSTMRELGDQFMTAVPKMTVIKASA